MLKLTRTLLYIFSYVLTAALLLSYLSVFIPPDKCWIPAFFGLAFPYLLTTNIFLLVYWLVRLKKESIVLLVVILLGWNPLSHFYRLPVPHHENRDMPHDVKKISVMTFNVRLFNIFTTGKVERPADKIIKFLKKNRPDILCLQEFYTDPPRLPEQKIIQSLNYPYHYISYIEEGHRNARYGLIVFSRYPMLNKKNIRFANSFNQSQSCDLVIGKDTLRLFNNHLQSTRLIKKEIRLDEFNQEGETIREVKDISVRLRTAFIKRAKQARILKQHIRQSPYPVLVCGDFNDTPVSYTYHLLSGNLADAFVESGSGFGKTYHGLFPSFRIDYVLHDRQWRAITYHTYHNRLSDHFPVTCTLVKEDK